LELSVDLDLIPGVGDLFFVQLQDSRTRTTVSFRDVGAGVGQVLPILVQCLVAENNLVLVEQPELHLHPRLQSELGDLFIDAALGECKNTFLIETHSEHLLLRVMKRMRQTAAGRLEGSSPPVRPEDVCVLFVHPTEHGSIVRQLRLSEDGELLDPWPNGFFEERFSEIFD
jgi:predicted ATPase